MSTRGLILDMNGVVIDDLRWHERAWMAFAARHGVAVSLDDFRRRLSGKRNAELIPELLQRAVSGEELGRLEDEKESAYREIYHPHLAPLPGLREFLAAARTEGVQLALATSAPRANIDFVLDGLSLRSAFDVVVTGAEVPRGKPFPDVFLRAAERLAVPPGSCIVFEDSLNGVAAGVAAGMKVVGVTTTHTAEELQGCTVTVAHFQGLTVAGLPW